MPIHIAVEYMAEIFELEFLDMIKELSSNGANLNPQDLSGNTPLHIAVSKSNFV
jgi:ankyrin repeat protein